jgi:hypothetical protein
MAWRLRIWFGYGNVTFARDILVDAPAYDEEFAVKADAETAAADMLASAGHTVVDGGDTHFYPVGAITRISLTETT